MKQMTDHQARQYFIHQAQLAGLLKNKKVSEQIRVPDSAKSLDQTGGYPKGFRLLRDPQGRRQFTVEVTREIRDLLNLPDDQKTYGKYQNKKVFEAARKAYNEICLEAKKKGRDCPALKITMLDTYNETAKSRAGQKNPPKISEYYAKRFKNPVIVKYKSKNRPVVYNWETVMVPIKKGQDYEGSIALKRERSRIAKEKYKRLQKVPSRYPLKSASKPKSNRPRTAPVQTQMQRPSSEPRRPRTAPVLQSNSDRSVSIQPQSNSNRRSTGSSRAPASSTRSPASSSPSPASSSPAPPSSSPAPPSSSRSPPSRSGSSSSS